MNRDELFAKYKELKVPVCHVDRASRLTVEKILSGLSPFRVETDSKTGIISVYHSFVNGHFQDFGEILFNSVLGKIVIDEQENLITVYANAEDITPKCVLNNPIKKG